MFPIAECFVSPQGEGTHTGRLMIFLRLAGCTVGTRYPKEMYETDHHKYDGDFPMYPSYTNECHIYDGRTMSCDTNYTKKLSVDKYDLVSMLKKIHATCGIVCVTGGEPLMHGETFKDLSRCLIDAGYEMHLETSGTIPLDDKMISVLGMYRHISVSPKLGFRDEYIIMRRAHDVKLLIDENFDVTMMPSSLFNLFMGDVPSKTNPPAIYLQPVNGENTVNADNLKRCLDLQMIYPHLRLSVQNHKFWGVE